MMQVDGVRIASAGDTFFSSSVVSAALFGTHLHLSVPMAAGQVVGSGHPSYPIAVGPLGGPGHH